MEEKKGAKRGRPRKVGCRSDCDGSTQKLYAMAVDRFFGGYADKNSRFSVLSAEEERELIERLRDNRPELEKELVTHNIFLAIGFASRQQHRFSDFDELLSLSMYGLVEAATKFDIDHGCRFNTYAVWYLKKHVLRQFYVKKEHEIADNTSIFIDDAGCGDRQDGDFVYATINSHLEATLEGECAERGVVEGIERGERTERMKETLGRVLNTVATSSLSDTDKRIFDLSFLHGEDNTTVSQELGISYSEVTKGRKRVMTFLNENFSKDEIFAA